MRYEHLFIIDPLASLNLALDSSLRLMFALAGRGHAVAIATTKDLAWTCGEGAATANCQSLHFRGSPTDIHVEPPTKRPLSAFAAVHMRKDPPYDMDYVATTWLLDAAGPKTRVFNAPESLRRFNEKLAIFQFPADCHAALVSSDAAALLDFIEGPAQGDAVLKPLTLFGGRGVERLQIAAVGRDAVLAKLQSETGDGSTLRLVQPFDAAIFTGEVRVFTAFGEPIAWCLKRPSGGNFLANTRAGATLEPYRPTPVEAERVGRIAKTLLRSGVALIGFDLIGGYVSEINLTSPRLLQAPVDKTDYYGPMAALFESHL